MILPTTRMTTIRMTSRKCEAAGMKEFKVQRERYIEKCIRAAEIAEKCEVRSVHYRKDGDKKWIVGGVRVNTEGTSSYYDSDIAQAIGRYFCISHENAVRRLWRCIKRGRRWAKCDGAILRSFVQDTALRHKTRLDIEK